MKKYATFCSSKICFYVRIGSLCVFGISLTFRMRTKLAAARLSDAVQAKSTALTNL